MPIILAWRFLNVSSFSRVFRPSTSRLITLRTPRFDRRGRNSINSSCRWINDPTPLPMRLYPSRQCVQQQILVTFGIMSFIGTYCKKGGMTPPGNGYRDLPLNAHLLASTPRGWNHSVFECLFSKGATPTPSYTGLGLTYVQLRSICFWRVSTKIA